MRVIKLGGSLHDWPDLPACLAELTAPPSVIVPGGGLFADQVRRAQAAWQFDDRTAHDMALLAMAQFGRMLTGLEPRLAAARSTHRINAALAAGHSAVWLPNPTDDELQAIPASWEVTSDSLAAWLAHRLAATELVLVKSAPLHDGTTDIAQLSAAGWVDPAFEAGIAAAGFASWICQRTNYHLLAGELREAPGLRRIRTNDRS